VSDEFLPQISPSFDVNEADALRDYVLSGGWGTEFHATQEFEAQLCAFTGAKHCIAVTSGTTALSVALLAQGIGPGDEIVMPDLTMIATPNSARMIGATPVFVDVESHTLTLDIAAVERALTPRTKAIIYVSLNGRSGDIDALLEVCRAKQLTLIEDAAQALGSFTASGRHLGTIGNIGCLSFSPPKIISTGQGGAVLTNDDDIAKRIIRIKDFGRASGGHDIHDTIGFNFKFTDFQSTVGLEQMKKLPWRQERKKAIWHRYRDGLAGLNGIAWIDTDTDHVTPWFIDIFIENPDALATHLKNKSIGSRPIYPPIHSQVAYGLNELSFPVTEYFASRGLWLPSATDLSDSQIDRVVESIREFV
jgi:perosamine synthetase